MARQVVFMRIGNDLRPDGLSKLPVTLDRVDVDLLLRSMERPNRESSLMIRLSPACKPARMP